METIKVKYFTDKIEKLRFIDEKSDWVDLRAAERIELKTGEFSLIPLGIGIKLPDGYEAHVAPRSSTYKNYGIIQVNSVGVIDESFCGNDDEWKMPVLATRDSIIEINDRICQFRIIKKQPLLVFEEVTEMSDVNRGGHGSTGKQ